MKKLLFLLTSLLCLTAVQGKVVMPSLFADNMVLQQQSPARFWGKAAPQKRVTVIPSWNNEKTTVKSAADGHWEAIIQTPKAGGPYTISISDGEVITLRNVLIGEVWLCLGQSNMEMPMSGKANQPIAEATNTIALAKQSVPIRSFTLEKAAARTPQYDCVGEWKINSPEMVASTSAVGYFFADYLHRALDVPVGIIISSWGGTKVQAWMNRQTFEPFNAADLSFLDDDKPIAKPKYKPCMLYYGMIAPLETFTIKGFLWYQGESNRKNPQLYRQLMPAFVEMLREGWDQGELPFYYVQIAPFAYDDPDQTDGAEIREAQLFNLKEIPNSAMAVTMDLGDKNCIHPAGKRKVGERLAHIALSKSYGIGGFDVDTPQYEKMEIEDGKIYLTFDCGAEGLAPLGAMFEGFEVASDNGVFHNASAKIHKETGRIELFCAEVTNPVAVRYCFRNYACGTLYNRYGVPVSSFRTDDWSNQR